VKRSIAVVMMLTGIANPTAAPAEQGEAGSCLVEVLTSEELPVGPLFHHTYRATLRVTPPNRPPFVTTVQRVMPWQAPPPRQGQRQLVSCDPALIDSSFRLF
jgi:hypothetical protein